jgi:tRNA1Val (adenine37-N6)-methyltransferase
LLLYQPKNGYCYNSDTHILYSFIKKNLDIFKNIKGELLDIGSGSGILGILICKYNNNLRLNQCEIQDIFQKLSFINSKNNNIGSNLYKGDFTILEFDKKFEICISNPPFYKKGVVKSKNENIKIARYNEYLPLEAFIKKSYNILTQNGKFFFCYDVKQLDDIIYLLNIYKFNIESIQFIHPNIDKNATLVLIYARKNSKSMTKVLEPIVVFENGEFSMNINKIYNATSTYSIKVDL